MLQILRNYSILNAPFVTKCGAVNLICKVHRINLISGAVGAGPMGLLSPLI